MTNEKDETMDELFQEFIKLITPGSCTEGEFGRVKMYTMYETNLMSHLIILCYDHSWSNANENIPSNRAISCHEFCFFFTHVSLCNQSFPF